MRPFNLHRYSDILLVRCISNYQHQIVYSTDEFPTQMASNAENVSIWWCHHDNWISYAVETSVVMLKQPSVHIEAHWTEASFGFMLGSPHIQTNGPVNETLFLSCRQNK